MTTATQQFGLINLYWITLLRYNWHRVNYMESFWFVKFCYMHTPVKTPVTIKMVKWSIIPNSVLVLTCNPPSRPSQRPGELPYAVTAVCFLHFQRNGTAQYALQLLCAVWSSFPHSALLRPAPDGAATDGTFLAAAEYVPLHTVSVHASALHRTELFPVLDYHTRVLQTFVHKCLYGLRLPCAGMTPRSRAEDHPVGVCSTCEKLPSSSPNWLHYFTFPPAANEFKFPHTYY